MPHSKKRWDELSPLARLAIIKLAALDIGLKAWALADLVNRPQDQVQGSKAAWAVALSVVSSAGVLPAVYLVWARAQH